MTTLQKEEVRYFYEDEVKYCERLEINCEIIEILMQMLDDT